MVAEYKAGYDHAAQRYIYRPYWVLLSGPSPVKLPVYFCLDEYGLYSHDSTLAIYWQQKVPSAAWALYTQVHLL